MTTRLLFPFVAAFVLSRATAGDLPADAQIEWQPWSDQIFKRAKAEHKLVLLDLGAAWCHWCHVMDEVTYADPKVIELIRANYLAVRVDQDARPDLANRYEDYGWPASIVFKWDGTELAKRRGYIPPKPMSGMLQAFIDDPTPGPSIEPEPEIADENSALTKEQRAAMRDVFIKAYDPKRGGWGDVHKYLNWDALEFCLMEGAAGDSELDAMARQTLEAGLKLVDPVWGGVYQYSTDGDWDHPHFEKIMPFQAENIRVFALAAVLLHEPKWLEPAQKIHGYLRDFLTSPDGAFFTSQDADAVPGEHGGEYFALNDPARRKRGIPRIDQHIYARENGLAITGLCALYAASGDASCLAEARRAAEWVIKNRALPDGGFRHDENDGAGGPYLADTLAMARAFLALYTVTAERPWLEHAQKSVAFIDAHFGSKNGFVTAGSAAAAALPPRPQADENVMLVRCASLLFQHTGNEKFQAVAERAMHFLASPAVVKSQGFGTSGILLAREALTKEPAHLTVVGGKDDPAARALFVTALRGLPMSARIEWLDAREGPLPRADVQFPPLTKSSAFLCIDGSCSIPMTTPDQLATRLDARKGGKK